MYLIKKYGYPPAISYLVEDKKMVWVWGSRDRALKFSFDNAQEIQVKMKTTPQILLDK